MGQDMSTGLADCCVNDSATKEPTRKKRHQPRKSEGPTDPAQVAAIGLQRLFRGYGSRQKTNSKIRSQPRPIYAKVNFAEDLLETDSHLVSTIDPYVMITCVSNSTYKHLPEGSQVALAKTDTLKNAAPKGPIAWDQEVLLAPSTGDVKLLVTVLSHSTFGRDECLGQVLINLYSNGNFKLQKELTLPLAKLDIPVCNEDGVEMTLRQDRTPQGQINLALRTVPHFRSKVGPAYLLQEEKGLMGSSSSWVNHWMVLAENLTVYSEANKSTPLKSITMDKIIEIKDIVYRQSIHEEGLRAIRLRLQDQDDWYFRMEEEDEISDWLEKLRRAAIQVQFGVEVY